MAKKRANGEGSIRRRKDGRWEERYTAGYDPQTGERIIKNVLGKTQAEVKAKLKLAVEQAQRLDVIRADDYTAASWLRTWYELYNALDRAVKERLILRNPTEDCIIPKIEKQEMKILHPEDMRGPDHTSRPPLTCSAYFPMWVRMWGTCLTHMASQLLQAKRMSPHAGPAASAAYKRFRLTAKTLAQGRFIRPEHVKWTAGPQGNGNGTACGDAVPISLELVG